jgi:hypothetical protein
MRTIMNYQYRHGTGLREAAVTLYNQGGYGRYYDGLGAALFQGPLSRYMIKLCYNSCLSLT